MREVAARPAQQLVTECIKRRPALAPHHHRLCYGSGVDLWRAGEIGHSRASNNRMKIILLSRTPSGGRSGFSDWSVSIIVSALVKSIFKISSIGA